MSSDIEPSLPVRAELRPDTPTSRPGAKVVVATTVALAFISFWRASSIVLSDLASSAFYAGGIAEHAIGRSAPWFVLGVMLFSFAVRSVYLESSSMFVRGGVYVVVRDAMGPFIARISVSSLLFDYILTGPISVVSAGQYLSGLVNEVAASMGSPLHLSPNWFSAGFAVLVTIYFWWLNIQGMHESSGKALRIMQITTVMVVIFLVWCPLTLLLRGGPAQLPPAPIPANLQFADDALGWFRGTFWPTIGPIAVIIALGHSLLSMSGFETLAQVYREIAYPKLKNLRITGNIVCIYAVSALARLPFSPPSSSRTPPGPNTSTTSSVAWPCTSPALKSCVSSSTSSSSSSAFLSFPGPSTPP